MHFIKMIVTMVTKKQDALFRRRVNRLTLYECLQRSLKDVFRDWV